MHGEMSASADNPCVRNVSEMVFLIRTKKWFNPV